MLNIEKTNVKLCIYEPTTVYNTRLHVIIKYKCSYQKSAYLRGSAIKYYCKWVVWNTLTVPYSKLPASCCFVNCQLEQTSWVTTHTAFWLKPNPWQHSHVLLQNGVTSFYNNCVVELHPNKLQLTKLVKLRVSFLSWKGNRDMWHNV